VATFHFTAGGAFETLTKPELQDALAADADVRQRQQLGGVRDYRIPVLQGQAVGGLLDIGGDVQAALANGQPNWSGQRIGPTQGFSWTILRLAVSGLTAGVTPDVVNLIKIGAGPDPIWQFTGNTFFATYSRGSIILNGGEGLRLVNVGTFAATGNIRLTGEGIITPTEMVGKLLV
jgi:hypothetical protein